jgi:hypothetical protein
LAGTDRAFGWVVDGVAAVALAAMTFHPLCNLVFRCGCAWFFAGAADHCNIHDPAPPNCPPCANMAAGAAFGAALVGGWLAAARAVRAGYSGTKVTS